MTPRYERPKCLACNDPADVLVTDREPYCAKHGLPILKQQQSSRSWNITFDKRSNGYAARHDNQRA